MTRSRWRALVVALVVALGVAVPATPAAADEVFGIPATGVLTIEGRGWGHGMGLSQWGAYGAATRGLTTGQILAFYYPGTSTVQGGNPLLRVALSSGNAVNVTVDALDTMLLTWPGGAPTQLPSVSPATGAAITAWRLGSDPAGTGVVAEFLEQGGTWRRFMAYSGTSGDFTSTRGQVRLVGPSGGRTDYRGTLRAVRSATGMLTVNVVEMESYLRSVVPSESPASWPYAALGAQAMAARSYALFEQASAAGGAASDTCDSTRCQVYAGRAQVSADGTVTRLFEDPRSDAAVSGTAGQSLTYGGGPAFTQFSASNGGYSVAGSRPYLVAQLDPYDGAVPSSANAWTTTVTRASIASAYPAVGQPSSVVVLQRDGRGEFGGRITSARVVGSTGSVTVSGDALRASLGLKSTLWTARASATGTDVNGDGRVDLLVRDSTGDLVLHPGTPTGVGPSSVVGSGWGSLNTFVCPGDATGDGVADLWARATWGDLILYGLRSDGVPTSQRTIGTGWGGARSLTAAGDVNGDGSPDLYSTFSSGDLWLYFGDGRGGISGQRQVGTGWGGMDTILGGFDITSDGVPDVLARQSSSGLLYLYAGIPGGGVREGVVKGTGWGGLDMLRAHWARADATVVYGRTSAGDLLRYTLSPAGVWGGPTTVASGWGGVSLLW